MQTKANGEGGILVSASFNPPSPTFCVLIVQRLEYTRKHCFFADDDVKWQNCKNKRSPGWSSLTVWAAGLISFGRGPNLTWTSWIWGTTRRPNGETRSTKRLNGGLWDPQFGFTICLQIQGSSQRRDGQSLGIVAAVTSVYILHFLVGRFICSEQFLYGWCWANTKLVLSESELDSCEVQWGVLLHLAKVYWTRLKYGFKCICISNRCQL